MNMLPIVGLAVAGVVSAVAGPVVFRTSEGVAPGDLALLYGGGLSNAETVLVRSLDGGNTEIPAPAIQPCENSVKFVVPAALGPGVFSVQVVAGGERSAPRLINRPDVWFLQPTTLRPGLDENQAPPGAEVQVIGRNFAGPNRIEHGSVGIQIGPNVTGAALGVNAFSDVAAPVQEARPGSALRMAGP